MKYRAKAPAIIPRARTIEITEIINQGLTKCVGITKYIDDKLLVSLAGTTSSTTKITDMKYYSYDITTGTIEEIS